MSIRHVDGLVQRLLQQHDNGARKGADVRRGTAPDRVSISREARALAADQPPSRVESQLMQMYGARGA